MLLARMANVAVPKKFTPLWTSSRTATARPSSLRCSRGAAGDVEAAEGGRGEEASSRAVTMFLSSAGCSTGAAGDVEAAEVDRAEDTSPSVAGVNSITFGIL